MTYYFYLPQDFDDNDSEDVNHDIDYKNKKDEVGNKIALAIMISLLKL